MEHVTENIFVWGGKGRITTEMENRTRWMIAETNRKIYLRNSGKRMTVKSPILK